MEELSRIPEKPLIPKEGKIEVAKRVYFFEREDGSVFFAQGQEAWTIYKGRAQIIGRERPKNKFIGSSDGSIFRAAAIESQKIFRAQGLPAAQECLRKGQESELEMARGKMIPPPNFDTVTQGNIPIDLANFK